MSKACRHRWSPEREYDVRARVTAPDKESGEWLYQRIAVLYQECGRCMKGRTRESVTPWEAGRLLSTVRTAA
jgi:hypothetical protein